MIFFLSVKPNFKKFLLFSGKNFYCGFTLFEILVTISIGLVIGLSGVEFYANFNRRQIVDRTAIKIASDLRLAQNLTLSQQKPVNCECSLLRGYSVHFTQDGYFIRAECDSACQENHKSVSLSNVSVQGISQIKFYLLTQEVEITGGENLTVSDSAGTYSKQIIVSPSGEIKIK